MNSKRFLYLEVGQDRHFVVRWHRSFPLIKCGVLPSSCLEDSCTYLSSVLLFTICLQHVKSTTQGPLLFLSPTPSPTCGYYESQPNSDSTGCFSEHSTLSVSLKLKSKPSTVDCTLWLTMICFVALGICSRQETKTRHTGTTSFAMKRLFFNKVTINIHCCRWVELCGQAHWTMNATVAPHLTVAINRCSIFGRLLKAVILFLNFFNLSLSMHLCNLYHVFSLQWKGH